MKIEYSNQPGHKLCVHVSLEEMGIMHYAAAFAGLHTKEDEDKLAVKEVALDMMKEGIKLAIQDNPGLGSDESFIESTKRIINYIQSGEGEENMGLHNFH